MDNHLVLQLGDLLARGHQLRVTAAGHSLYLAAVDQLLAAPGIDRLGADLQIVRPGRPAAPP
jgi:hypothetical protein